MKSSTILQPTFLFLLPTPHSTIESAKVRKGMTEECHALLTEANFGTPPPPGRVKVGFLEIDHDYKFCEAADFVAKLAHKTTRRIRLGNPVEALLNMGVNPHADQFSVLGKDYQGRYLFWVEDRFVITPEAYPDGFPSSHLIFIAEDF